MSQLQPVMLAWVAGAVLATAGNGAVVPAKVLPVVASSIGVPDYERKAVPVELTIQNIGDRTITGYTYVVTGRYPNGTTRGTSATVDDVSVLVAERVGLPIKREGTTLRAGEVKLLRVMLPMLDGGTGPAVIDASVTAVAFSDGTVAGGSEAISQLRHSRQKQIDDLGPVIADLVRINAAANPAEAIRQTLSITRVGTDSASNRRRQVMEVLLQAMERDAAAAAKTLRTYQTYQSVLTEQSNLKEDK
jgi:hypothetical protein